MNRRKIRKVKRTVSFPSRSALFNQLERINHGKKYKLLTNSLWFIRTCQFEFISKGFKKRDLLREILPIIAQNVALQRVYVFFKKQLSLVDSMDQKSSTSVLDRIRGSTSMMTTTTNKSQHPRPFLTASRISQTSTNLTSSQPRSLETLRIKSFEFDFNRISI